MTSPALDRAPTLTGTRVTLRRLQPSDRDVLRTILAQPETAMWWDVADVDPSGRRSTRW